MSSTEKNTTPGTLERRLTNRHIQLIALGGAIGTGLFLGINPATVKAGPSVILGYAIAGFIAFLIMRQLGEMVVEEPVAGSFSHFANKYCGPFLGFVSGWNYWMLYILVSMAELTAIGVYVQFWFPHVALWQSSLFFFVLVNLINLANVRIFGEAEFWFSIIKVLTIIAMIAFGSYLLLSGRAGPQATITNLWNDGGFFPHGIAGLTSAMALIMFAFGGLELIGITAAEAQDPEKTIPKATNQVIYRVLIFYIGALVVLFALWPWRSTIASDTSPFVSVFNSLESLPIFSSDLHITTIVSHVLNAVVLTAALSVYNSSVYCNSRMLYGLALQNHAPQFLRKLNRSSVPVRAIMVSSFFAALCVVVNYVAPKDALSLLMVLVVASLIINWLLITVAHYFFRRAKDRQGIRTKFPMFCFPLSNLVSLTFLLGILVIMWFTGMEKHVYAIPVWLGALYGGYKIYEYRLRNAARQAQQ